MKTSGLKIAGIAVSVLAVIVVAKIFWPAETKPATEITSEIQAKAPKAVEQQQPDARAERLYEMALLQKETAESSPENYEMVLVSCWHIIRRYPDTPQAEKAKQLLQEVPEQYRKQYSEKLSFLYPSEPKVKKSRPLRRRVPKRYYIQPGINTEEISKAD